MSAIHSLKLRHSILDPIPKNVSDHWPKPNTVDPVTRGLAVPITSCIFLLLCVTACGIDLYTAKHILGGFRLNQVFVVMGLIMMFVLTVCMNLLTEHFQQNRHVWDMVFPTEATKHAFLKINWATPLLLMITNFFIKATVLDLVRRLIKGNHMPVARGVYRVSIIFLGLAALAYIIAMFHICNPLSDYWRLDDDDVKSGRTHLNCNATMEITLGVVATLWQLFETVICAVLPCTVVWKLQFKNKTKRIQLLCIFALGFGVVAIDMIRSAYSIYISQFTYDYTWYLWLAGFLALLETWLGYLAACAPSIKTFWTYMATKHKQRKESATVEQKWAELERVIDEEKADFWDRPMLLNDDELRWMHMVFQD